MQSESDPTTPIRQLLPGLTMLSALALATAGAVLGFAGLADMGVDAGTAAMVYVALGITGLTEPLLARYVILPAFERQGAAFRTNAFILGYSFVVAGGVYALLGGILSGAGWPALPLGAIALYGWAFIWMYLRELPENFVRAATTDGPRPD